MRQAHPAGERLFVDYAGQTVEIVDGRTGEVREAQVFVAAMGASSYTYAEATWTQSLPDWIGSHTRALAFMGGVPAQLVPDNPKVGVDRANWYEPGLNRTYLDLATHGTAILPTRVRKPRDKARSRWRCSSSSAGSWQRLRHRRFFSLAELNEAIAGLVIDLNARPMRRLGVSRRDLFLELDRPALKPLPPAAYEYAEWRLRRVSLDYHVDIDGHYYSVPYRLIRDQVEARLTARTVELFHQGERVAAHLRGVGRGRHTTVPEHMPSAPAACRWTIRRIGRTAASIGPSTAKLTSLILESRPHPEQGYRACLGILRLARQYGAERLEAACDRGLDIGARSCSIQSILQHGLDRHNRDGQAAARLVLPDRQSSRLPLLPLRRMHVADPPHPRSAAAAGARRDGQSLCGTRGEPEPCRALPCRVAGPPARPRDDKPAPRPSAMRGCATARLRHQAVVEDVDYRAARGLDRTLFQSLAAGRWIEEARNLIIEGPTGVGKVGWPVRSATKPAATTARSSTSACPRCSPTSRWGAATAAIRDSCGPLLGSSC